MSSAIKIPQPLEGEEIKLGIAKRMAAEFEKAVYASLGKSCSFNHCSFPKFRAKWVVEYHLDDFGKDVHGVMGGAQGDLLPGDPPHIEGEIPEVPPDQFRRETSQPIPAPQIIDHKPQPSEIGLSQNRRGRGREKTT